MLTRLPKEMIEQIFSFNTRKDQGIISQTCNEFYKIINNPNTLYSKNKPLFCILPTTQGDMKVILKQSPDPDCKTIHFVHDSTGKNYGNYSLGHIFIQNEYKELKQAFDNKNHDYIIAIMRKYNILPNENADFISILASESKLTNTN